MDVAELGQRLGRLSLEGIEGVEYLGSSLPGRWRGAVLTHVATQPGFAFSGSWSWFRLSARLRPGVEAFPRPLCGWPMPEASSLQLGLPGKTYAGRWDVATESASLFLDPASFELATHRPFSETALLEVAQRLSGDPVIEHLIGALLTDVQDGCRNGPCLGESIVAAVLHRLQGLCPGTPPGPRRRLSFVEVNRLRDFVDQHLADQIHLSDMARLLCMSPRHLTRLVKETLDTTPHGYIVRCRVERAQWLIRSTPLLLADIAAQTGFADQSHMSATFRRVLDVTPLQLRHS